MLIKIGDVASFRLKLSGDYLKLYRSLLKSLDVCRKACRNFPELKSGSVNHCLGLQSSQCANRGYSSILGNKAITFATPRAGRFL